MKLAFKLGKSLKAKFLFFSLSIFLLLFFCTGVFNYYKEKDELNEQMTTQVALAKIRAEKVLPALIWNSSEESIKDFTNAELKNAFISGMVVSDGSTVLYSAKTNIKNIISEQDFEPFEKQIWVVDIPLNFVEGGIDNNIGFAQILINHQLMESTLQEILVRQVLQSLGYCVVLFMLIWRLTSSLVLTPLLQLNNRLKVITDSVSNR
ncbi:hypothetical protein ACMAZF_01975 [Psychrobium sp. nBUS_13]|uniref:hypothetical protein n=1 Tax=Psychrobium sp. nBUS_13 TaxID=3395319 RepID=UPI003EBAF967